ncbi:MAG TPA: hypothetical protein VMT98_19140 [Verrucomicrobiae bacterium]|jgi:hypothetical protein|nr:hypothetical protein [Verrucomicrobiae bacterium]
MLHSLLKAYGDAYSAAVNQRIPEYPRNDPYFADQVSASEKTQRLGRGWLALLSVFF